MADTPLQSKSYNTNTAATSHQLTLSNPVAARSTLVAIISYDGLSGAQASSITGGGSWSCPDVTNLKQSNSLGVNGEMWIASNISAGSAPTITFNFASSVKASITVAEYAGILSYATPLDKAIGRIHTPAASQFRSSGNSAARTAPVEVVIGGMCWNSALITTMVNGTNWTTDTFTYNSSSLVGSAIGHRTNESPSRSGAVANASFRFSDLANVSPCAVLSGAFYREGVFPTSDEDGNIKNIEGTVTVDTTTLLVFMSSYTAPLGGTGASEKTDSYWFFDTTLPSGVTIDPSGATFNFTVLDGFDDGIAITDFSLYTDKAAINGATLTSDDEGRPTTNAHSLGTAPTVATPQSVALVPSDEINPSGITNARMSMTTDTITSTYSHIADYTDFIPAYIRCTLIFPAGRPTFQAQILG